MECSPDIADKGKHRHAAQQEQESPVDNSVCEAREEYDPDGEEAVLEDDSLGTVFPHQPLHDCGENMRTKLCQVTVPRQAFHTACVPYPPQFKADKVSSTCSRSLDTSQS